ncbi:MAG: RNA-binding protein [Aeromonadaceae bacterium]|nr:RNA-binding protein [Aeromonadaceae bacterium]
MNKSLSTYIKAGIAALLLGTLGYFVAPLAFSTPDTDISLVASLVAIVASVVTTVVLSFGCTQGSCTSATSSAQGSDKSSAAKAARPVTFTGEVKTLYVGNLPYRANETAIRKLFSEHGTVISVRLVKDKETGKRRGYGFVEMPESEAKAAVAALNETEYLQRTLKVREANDKRDHQDGETSFTEN